MSEETRVRIGGKQKADGAIQIDLTAEAPTVDEAGELLEGAIKKAVEKFKKAGLTISGQ